ncbi:hypothetical protein ACTXT7_004843 [Hymenolepis weldensis]
MSYAEMSSLKYNDLKDKQESTTFPRSKEQEMRFTNGICDESRKERGKDRRSKLDHPVNLSPPPTPPTSFCLQHLTAFCFSLNTMTLVLSCYRWRLSIFGPVADASDHLLTPSPTPPPPPPEKFALTQIAP